MFANLKNFSELCDELCIAMIIVYLYQALLLLKTTLYTTFKYKYFTTFIHLTGYLNNQNNMKKLITIMICVCMANISYAQLKVNSNGGVTVCRTQAPVAALSVGDGFNLYPATNTNITTYSSALLTPGYYNIGMTGISYINNIRNNGRAIGVYGVAGNSTNGFNYGVFGSLYTSLNGAGIYGTINPDLGVNIDGRYAGYFDGATKIDGDLTVTGNISGVILGISSVANTSQTYSLNTNTDAVSDKLVGFSAIPYYMEQPVILEEKNDTGSTVRPLGLIESQTITKKHYALSASQLAEIYPDFVYENEDGTKMINYVGMIPLLVQAISELKAEITELKGSKAKSISYNGSTGIDGLEIINAALLSQNNPNPFTTATNIEMQIPSEASVALFCIYDMSGKQVKQITINERGKTTLNVTSEGLNAGMYLYSLIIDGKVIDTRRMILTK